MLSKIDDSDLLRTSYSIFEIWTALIFCQGVCYLWVWLHWSRCTSSWLVLWSSWRPSSSPRPHRPPPWPFLCFFSPTNYFPLKSSKGSKCQSSRCLKNNCHNRHCRFSSWVFLYLPLRLKSGTEGKKLVIPKMILLLTTFQQTNPKWPPSLKVMQSKSSLFTLDDITVS